MDAYFSRFPIISYSNTAVLDITRHVAIESETWKIPNIFYPVELLAGMRADVLADAYYEDSELDWLVYLSNQTVDPYYHWYLGEEDFQSYLNDKYTDLTVAERKVKFYRNNWAADDTEITPSFYYNTLSLDQKQYYSPQYGEGAKVVSFRRKAVDWMTNTNKIHRYDRATAGDLFTPGELVKIHPGNIASLVNAEFGGAAEVITSNSTSLIVQSISGNSIANSSWTKVFVGETSNTIFETTSYEALQVNISDAEAVFWGPVTFFDWERERNEERKHVFLLNPDLVPSTSLAIRDKLNQ